ncbi:MAG: hypothetical protein QN188_09005 [Armatimonadota bacterium]|nr:hypothetical protein [Armatimonadota bacterium]MDR5675181.1 hypothetical protein [Armatimonadota bacterium]MDR5689945.1 hypothetical protein [Armatimonadota bacterium]MDR7389748.1 hypothetical protein [Armatimonadota bacterium]MDR7390907.1 hypothetical protein [Armatimonadota bacterium]
MVAAAVLAGLVPSGSAQPEPPSPTPVLLVDPGRGIGPYRLELGLERILARLGRAGAERAVVDMAQATRDCTVRARGRVVRFTWRPEGLWVTADADTGALRVLAAFGTSGPFVTDRGVRLGTPLDRAERLYGPGAQHVECELPRGLRARVIRYRDLGIQFTGFEGPTPHAGRVWEIGVFRPGVF